MMLDLERRWGEVVRVPMPGGPAVVLCTSPETIRAVFTADPMSLQSGGNPALATILGSGSIFLQSGEAHRRTRRLLMPPFHGERMRAYTAVMHEAAVRWTEAIPRGRSAPILPIAQSITLDVIVSAIFGEQDPERVRSLHDAILAVVASFSPWIATLRALQRSFGGLGPWARFQRASAALSSRLQALVDDKRARPGDDVLSLLVQARDEAGEPLSDREILEQLRTFIIAGHETTATSLAWALYELHRTPEALSTLRDALAAAPRSDPEEHAKIPLLQAVCSETLRMHPPVPMVPRVCTAGLSVGGFELEPGATVAAAIYNAHHREQTFDAPHRFRPARFLERTYSPFEYLPWGGGHRRCLGASFAQHELAVTLAALLTRCELSLDEPRPVANAFRIGTYGPSTGIRMTRRH